MAAEKRSQSGPQSIVDQDAAITAYLDGLLRDPEQEEGAEPARGRKTPGLTVINKVEMASAASPEVDAEDEPAAEAATETADEAAVGESKEPEEEVAVETPQAPAEEGVEPAAEGPSEPEATAAPSDPDVLDEPAAETDTAPMAEPEEPAAVPAEAETPEAAGQASDEQSQAEVETSPWAWLRVGGMVLAVPAEAVVSRHSEPALDPVPGAPAQVAGSLTVEGRPRLILSLPAVTGARPRGDASEVLLLGKGGLWGVLGEPVAEPVAFDEETVQWRSEAQKAERRGWLAGTVPSAGVAVLDVAGLRAALKGSR